MVYWRLRVNLGPSPPRIRRLRLVKGLRHPLEEYREEGLADVYTQFMKPLHLSEDCLPRALSATLPVDCQRASGHAHSLSGEDHERRYVENTVCRRVTRSFGC